MRSKYVDVEGVAVNFFHSGESTLPHQPPALDRGELIVFLHDAGANANLWHRQGEILAADHSVLAFDFPGHGRSGGTEGLDSVAAQAGFLDAFVHAVGLRPMVLVGKGFGAATALEYGALHGRQVRGLVLIGCSPRVEVAETTLGEWGDVMRGRRPQPFSKNEFSSATSLDVMREVWMEQVRTDPRVRYTDLVAWGEADFSSRLTDVRQPVLVVAGSEDEVVRPEASQELCPQLPNVRLEVVEKAGHSIELEQPEALAERIGGFVSSLDRDAA